MNTDRVVPPDDMETDTTDRSGRAEALRQAWIRAVREFKERQTGAPCFYKTKPRWDGGYDANTGRFYKTPVWPKLVTEADEVGVDPLLLVETLFGSITGEHAPQPPDLLAVSNVRRAQRRDADRATDVAAAVTTQSNIFRTELWAAGRTTTDPHPMAPVRRVLNDLSLPLSPLFRYAMANAAGLADLAAAWVDRARVQYATSPDLYDRYWQHLLPAGTSLTHTTSAPGAL